MPERERPRRSRRKTPAGQGAEQQTGATIPETSELKEKPKVITPFEDRVDSLQHLKIEHDIVVRDEILKDLGLSQADVDSASEEVLKEEAALRRAFEKGKGSFDTVRNRRAQGIELVDLADRMVQLDARRPEEVPDALFKKLDRMRELSEDPSKITEEEKLQIKQTKERYFTSEELTKTYYLRARAWVEGFGKKALTLQRKEWLVFINAMDVATDGGIRANQEAWERLRAAAKENPTEGVRIAKAVQRRLEKPKELESQE